MKGLQLSSPPFYAAYICNRACKMNHLSAKNCRFLAHLQYHNLITIYSTATKISSPTAEFNGLSAAAYGNEIVYSEQKILVKI